MLRSVKDLENYAISATDGQIAHIAGYLIDDETWAIRYIIVDTSNWWRGHKVLFAPEWITGVHWPNESVSVNLSRELVKNAPAYDPNSELNRQQALTLSQHYGQTESLAGRSARETVT